MKTITVIVMLMIAGLGKILAQEDNHVDHAAWEIESDVNLYFIPNDFIFLPVIRADHNALHLEARYNYEDLKTVSAWVGYNFSGGKKIEYTITPMAGVVTGQSNGVAPGFELTLTRNKLELTSETEYLIETDNHENSFMYTWTDLTYSPEEWFWFGLSAQKTRLYKTNLDIQRGILVGASHKKLEVTAYLYNLGFDTAFTLLTVTTKF